MNPRLVRSGVRRPLRAPVVPLPLLPLLLLVLGAGGPVAAAAQLVTPKTAPIHQDEQFSIIPSDRMAMGGASIALGDTLLDPFVIPSRATRLHHDAIIVLPTSHSGKTADADGRTFPAAGYATRGAWAGGLVYAYQELAALRGPSTPYTVPNRYVAGTLARRIGDGLSIGAGALWGGLHGVNGLSELYAGSDTVDAHGQMVDLRASATRAWAGDRQLDLLVVHNRYDVAHDVHLNTWAFDTAKHQWTSTKHSEHDVDRTTAWGMHARYAQPLGADGWRFGLIATANRLSHPNIPDYRLASFQLLAHDPGTTYAYAIGGGVGVGERGPVSFGLDVVYEPMSSHAWADAARDTSVGSVTVRAGEHTVDNRFRFANLRIDVGWRGEWAFGDDSATAFGFAMGMGRYDVSYRLRQTDHLRDSSRTRDEAWTEFSPTFGLRARSRSVDVRYTIRLTCGPDPCLDFGDKTTEVSTSGGSVLVAPTGRITSGGGRVFVHQLSVMVPLF